MLVFGVFSACAFLAILFLVYCLIGFSRASDKRRYSIPSKQHPNVTRLPDDTGRFRDHGKIARLAIAGFSLAMPATLVSQASPANNTTVPAPLAAPAMVGPLSTASPKTFDAGPLGKLNITGTLSGFGSWQEYPNDGDKIARADISNAQVFLQKTTGFMQYFIQAGVYNIPALGTPTISTRNTISNLYGPLPQAYLKLSPASSFSFLIGKLPTLIGAEYTFTFENLNIERGLLWNQENSVNRGLQVNYGKGKISGSLAWSDGFYSNRYNWISGALTSSINSANSLEFVAGGNLGRTGYSNIAAPLYQNNGSIYDLIYTHTAKRWMIDPYLQYTRVPQNARIGVSRTTATLGGAISGSYIFAPHISVAGRVEYIGSTGSATDGAVNLLYGPGSGAWSATVTPTYQDKIFFARGEFSLTQATNITAGDAFGALGRNSTQARGVIETGFMF
jgi:hypothetical protein